jgi:predicted transcriptional regulator
MSEKPNKAATDWERIECEYRAGVKSLREIASEHGVTEGAIRKRAKRDAWPRDLGAKIKAKADELVRNELVRKEYAAATEKQVVDASAMEQASARLMKKEKISRNMLIFDKLASRIEAMVGNEDDFAKLGEIMAAPDAAGADKLNDIYRKAISTPGLVDTYKKFAETHKVLAGLLDDALGLDSNKPQTPGDALDNLLSALDGRTASLIPK